MERRALAWLVAMSGPFALARPVGAAPVALPIALTYRAPAGCPSRAVFLGEVLARSPWIREASAGEPAFRLAVVVETSANGSQGTLELRAADGAALSRTVAGRTCGEAVAALALTAALSLPEPAAPAAQSPATFPVRAPAAQSRAPSVAALRAPAPDPSAEDPLVERPEAPALAAAAPARGSRWRFAVGLDAAAAAGISPTPLLGARAVAEIRRMRGTVEGPAVRVAVIGGGGAASLAETASGAGARFVWTAGSAALCPLRARLGPLGLEPCAGIEAGVLQAAGTHVAMGASILRPWLSSGVIGRAEWRLSRRFRWEIEAEATAPWIRDRFLLGPGRTLHAVPAIVWIGSAGLKVVFP